MDFFRINLFPIFDCFCAVFLLLLNISGQVCGFSNMEVCVQLFVWKFCVVEQVKFQSH